jgi:uncharacterized RDD family membrane protein YckC
MTDVGSARVFDLASYRARAAAFLLDFMIVGLAAVLTIELLLPALFAGSSQEGGAEAAAALVMIGAILIPAAFYGPVTTCRRKHPGQTLGKQLMGIATVSEDGSFLTYRQALKRETVLKFLLLTAAMASVIGWVWVAVDLLWPLRDSQNRAMHDRIAKTRVVRAASAHDSVVAKVRAAPRPRSLQALLLRLGRFEVSLVARVRATLRRR